MLASDAQCAPWFWGLFSDVFKWAALTSLRQCLVFNNETISRLTSEVNCEKNLCSVKQDMKARSSFFNIGLKSDLRDDTIPAAIQHHHTFILNIFSNQIHQCFKMISSYCCDLWIKPLYKQQLDRKRCYAQRSSCVTVYVKAHKKL